MKNLDELASQYLEIDKNYSKAEFKAASRGWNRKEAQIRRNRDLNDQAYFLFMFSRMEDRIREQSAALIKRKKANITSWKKRASWDILPSKPDVGMSLKNRLALLCEKGGSDYNLIVEYYVERNSIAHGGNFVSPINMPSVVTEFKRLYKAVKA